MFSFLQFPFALKSVNVEILGGIWPPFKFSFLKYFLCKHKEGFWFYWTDWTGFSSSSSKGIFCIKLNWKHFWHFFFLEFKEDQTFLRKTVLGSFRIFLKLAFILKSTCHFWVMRWNSAETGLYCETSNTQTASWESQTAAVVMWPRQKSACLL